MKTLKNVFSIFLITFALVTLVSCGDKSEDPTPVNTTPVYVGYWKFQSAVVTPKNGSVYTINSLCSTMLSPEFNVEFDLTSKSDAIQKSCKFSDAILTYTGTIVNDKLTAIDFKDNGSKAYTYTNIVINETTKTITANQTFPIGNANTILVTFILQ